MIVADDCRVPSFHNPDEAASWTGRLVGHFYCCYCLAACAGLAGLFTAEVHQLEQEDGGDDPDYH
jgi:hypothetical protein